MSRLARYSRAYTIPLKESEIRQALRLGLGRVHLHQQAYGLTEHKEALFAACSKNLVYDKQCEPARATWLMGLVDPKQEEELLDHLAAIIPRARKLKNLYQICDLCLILAKKGHEAARTALYSAFQIAPYGETIAAREILDLDGAGGLRSLCLRTIELVDGHELENIIWSFKSHYDFQNGKGAAAKIITEEERLRALWQLFEPKPKLPKEARRIPQHSKNSVKTLEVTNVLDIIDSTDAAYYIRPLSFWSHSASEEELEEIAELLATEDSIHRLRHLLSVFRTRSLPRFEKHASTFLKLASHQDWHVKTRANTALSAVRHPCIREQTLKHLQNGEWLENQLMPLVSNLEPGDSKLLAKHLRVNRDAYKHHRLVFDLVEICEKNPWPEMVEIMLFIYQTSPCTNCRRTIYRVLDEINLVPGWIAEEWPYDVNSCDEEDD